MIVTNEKDVKKNKIETFPYRGKPYAVKRGMGLVAFPGRTAGFAGVWAPFLYCRARRRNPHPQSLLLPDDVCLERSSFRHLL